MDRILRGASGIHPMNHIIAYELVAADLDVYRKLPHAELCQIVGEETSRLKRGTDGIDYDVATSVYWRDGTNGDICVNVNVREANWDASDDALDAVIIVLPPTGIR
jgi:predicted heme/steroid binding protein